MENNFRTVELNPFRVFKEDLKVLEGLPIGIEVRTAETIRTQVERQERGRVWIGLAIVIFLFFLVGFSCAGCDGANNSLWIVMAIPVLLYMLLQRSISENELNEIIARRSRDLLTQEILQTKNYLETTPFLVRRANTLFENLPQLVFIENLIDRCKRESQFFSQKLLQFKSQLIDSLPAGQKIEDSLDQPEIRRLYLRIQLYQELMNSFEKSFGMMVIERDQLHIEREKIRMTANQDVLRKMPPAPILQLYPLTAPLEVNEEKRKQLEASFADTLRLSKSVDNRWRLLLEALKGDENIVNLETFHIPSQPEKPEQLEPTPPNVQN